MGSGSGTMGLDLNALRLFVFVVDAGGVTGAAQRAALPKSTVSRQIRDLEARLGTRLLERHGRGLVPTAAGRRLHDAARGAVGVLETLRHELVSPPVSGRVLVAMPAMLARGAFQEALAGILGRHPAIEIEIALTDRFSVADVEGADIALFVGIRPAPGDHAVPVGHVEARLYAAPALLGEHGTPRSPADVARLPVLAMGCGDGGRTSWSLTDPRGGVHEIEFRPRLVCADPDLLLAVALEGYGVCRVAPFLAEAHLRAGRLVPVLDGWVAERHAVSVVTLRRGQDPAVRRLAGEIADVLGGRAPR